jgi:hypothetical protein
MPYGTVNADLMTTSDGVSSSGLYGFKNRIYNGQMAIDQRNAGASVTVNSTGQAYPVDRFFGTGQSSDGVFTLQQSSTAPAGFVNSVVATVTTADASIGATQNYLFRQRVEGYNIADFNWGSANAKTVTFSFWVRSSLTGTFGGTLHNGAGDRFYPYSYTISAANTWEQKTITLAGDTTGTWETTNGIGLNIIWSFGTGSTLLAPSSAWTATTYTGFTGQTNLIGTNGATFYITGVQLEKGSTATSFDYRPYGVEMYLCQRYYQTYQYAQGFGAGFGMVRGNGTGNINYSLSLRQTMRTTPTEITIPTVGTSANNITFLNGESYAGTQGSLNTTNATADHIWFYFTGFSTVGTANTSTWAYVTGGSATFRIGAEL